MAATTNYFKPEAQGRKLPSPFGILSKQVSSSGISAANKHVREVKEKKRGPYQKYNDKEKARIAEYAILHRTSAAVRHFAKDFPDLKRTTINDWKDNMIKLKQQRHKDSIEEPVMELHSKKRGRPSTLSPELTEELKAYILELQKSGGVVNTAIVIAAATGLIQNSNPSLLECNGGHMEITKDWEKYFLGKLDFVKCKATTKAKVTVANFDILKMQYLQDIKAIVEMEDIPSQLIINWDQTGINYVPVSQWTMEKKGCKKVEVIGLNDKRQITAVFAGSLSGDFLPIQLVYQGKTSKCLPNVNFPETWDITCTPNHWCNEETTKNYITKIIVPYINNTKKELQLPETQPALVIFDEFTGQTTNDILKILDDNNLYYVIIPPNTTDKLQPMDLSVNKSAKEFLRLQLQNWYSKKISERIPVATSPSGITPVNLKLSVMKPVEAKWMMKLFDYFKSRRISSCWNKGNPRFNYITINVTM